jgi:hypothetical protein
VFALKMIAPESAFRSRLRVSFVEAKRKRGGKVHAVKFELTGTNAVTCMVRVLIRLIHDHSYSLMSCNTLTRML